MNAPAASIVIPTCQRPAELARCLASLSAQVPVGGPVEILVCDDSAEDCTKRLIAADFPGVTWQAGPRRGPAANRNSGARAGRGEWLIFVDDDCEPRAGFLQAYMEAIRGLGSRRRVAIEGATFRDWGNRSLLFEAPHNTNGGTLISCNFAMPRALFLEFGGFDERFPTAAFEDTEFAARLQLEGVGMIFVREAAVDHPLRPLPSPSKLAGRWESRVISTYDFGASTPQLLWHLPRHVTAVILSRFRGRNWDSDTLKAAGIFLCEYLWFLWGLPGWISRYRRAPRSAFWAAQIRLGKTPRRFGL